MEMDGWLAGWLPGEPGLAGPGLYLADQGNQLQPQGQILMPSRANKASKQASRQADRWLKEY